MDANSSVPFIFMGFGAALFALTALTVGLFYACSRHGWKIESSKRRRRWMVVYCLIATTVAVAIGVIPNHPIWQLMVGLIVLLLLGVPSTMGFLYGAAKHDDAVLAAREQQTMAWLMDWEREHLINAGEYTE